MIGLFHLLLCLGLAVFGGLGSAYYMISSGTSLTTRFIGPWQVWKDAGRTEADPYTRAHFAISGRLPAGSRTALYFLAERDGEGRQLQANCDYTVKGVGPDALWWSLSAYDKAGQLFANPAGRYAFNSADVMRTTDGTFSVTVSRHAMSGNWLPVTGSGPLRILLSVYGLDVGDARAKPRQDQAGLPVILKGSCR